MEQHFLEWLSRYGPVVLFLAQVGGIFALPIPDELLLTVCGALVRSGKFGATSVVFAAITGCAAGTTLSYILGRSVGRRALRRWVQIPKETVARAQTMFGRYGGWLLGFGYFVPGVRHVTAILAGSTPITFLNFAKYAYPGAALWSLTFLAVGYYAGQGWRPALTVLRPWLPLLGLLVILTSTVAVFTKWRLAQG